MAHIKNPAGVATPGGVDREAKRQSDPYNISRSGYKPVRAYPSTARSAFAFPTMRVGWSRGRDDHSAPHTALSAGNEGEAAEGTVTATIHQLKPKPSLAMLECSNCGATTNAACNCGVAYVPASQRAAEAITADPTKSNRAIADQIGVSEPTVRRARGASGDAPATVIGKDGKSYPAERPSKPAEPVSVGAQLDAALRKAWPTLPDDEREALFKTVNWLRSKAAGK